MELSRDAPAAAAARSRDRRRRLRLTLEYGVLFFGVPAALALGGIVRPVIPLLLLVFGGCLAYLLRDRSFDRRALWGWPAAKRELRRVGPRFVVVAGLIGAAMALMSPASLFDFPRRAPGIWVLVMFFYPLVSVYPQELIFRAFVFQRYRALFGGGAWMVWASAVAFGFAHVLFENWLAVVMTIPGGWLFADTYRRSRSLLAASIEHAAYGCFVFTIGLGRNFYNGL